MATSRSALNSTSQAKETLFKRRGKTYEKLLNCFLKPRRRRKSKNGFTKRYT